MRRSAAGEAAGVGELYAEIGRLERELARQARLNARMEEAVDEFVASLAHDLKNPLAAIKIGLQGFRRSLERTGAVGLEEGSERLDRLENAVEHAKELVAAARARALDRAAEPQIMAREPVDLVALLRQVLESFQAQVGAERIEMSGGPSRLVAHVDPRRIGQCVSAVVDNALKFSPPGMPVQVHLKREGGSAAMTCRDQGIGIPPADLPHIGERFYRAENVLGSYKGAGLGLFEAMGIVRAHDGRLSLESTVGQGTLVTVRLPLR